MLQEDITIKFFPIIYCAIHFVFSRFGLPWFAKRIIVASNDINEDTLFSLNQQVTVTLHDLDCKPYF